MLLCTLLSGCFTSQTAQHTPPSGFSDLHNSSLYRLYQTQTPDGLDNPYFPVHRKGLSAAGAQLVVFSIGIPRFDMESTEVVTLDSVLHFLRKFRTHVDQTYHEFQYVGNADDLIAAQQQDKTAYTLAMEGSWLCQGETRWVDSLHAVGVRVFQPAHRFVNPFFTAAGTHPPGPVFLDSAATFSAQGWELIQHLRSLNMILDVSHLPETAFWELIQSPNPPRLIASHANAHALCGIPRNLTDTQIKALADQGGLIGVCLHAPLLSTTPDQASIATLCDHIEHLIEVAGPQRICLGTDWEGLIRPVAGLESIEQLSALRAELNRRSLSPATIEAVLAHNALFLFGER